MKFTINIPITRKRTKKGYYLSHRTGARLFFARKADAIRAIEHDLGTIQRMTSVITCWDYAKKKGRKA